MGNDFKRLLVWEKAYQFALKIYKLTDAFPDKEQYRISAQLCRASLSIPSNIAEGKARNSLSEYIQFLFIARGSLEEVRCQLMFAKDLGYIVEKDYNVLDEEAETVSKLLNGLIKSLKSKK